MEEEAKDEEREESSDELLTGRLTNVLRICAVTFTLKSFLRPLDDDGVWR